MKEFPRWIRKRLAYSETASKVDNLLERLRLHTVCKSAACPNLWECFSHKRITFMILGRCCTRNCRFCAVKNGPAQEPDGDEPGRISEAVKILGLKHVVITSVTRDDLKDGGAGQFYKTVSAVKKGRTKTVVEILVPDFKFNRNSLKKVLDSPIDIFSHNIETVPRLYSSVRPQADYRRSLDVLSFAHKWRKMRGKAIKSGLMVGLGETINEVFGVISDLRAAGCGSLTIGQYLRPGMKQLRVSEYIHPAIFELYRKKALSMGFKYVLSSPFARTSYMAYGARSADRQNLRGVPL